MGIRNIRKKMCASFAGLALVTLAGCGNSSAASQSASSNGSTLRVAINPGFVPFEQIDSGKLTGFDVDLSQELARRLGRKNAAFDQLPFTSLLPAVTSGRDQ